MTHFTGEVERLETCEAYRQVQAEPTEPASIRPCSYKSTVHTKTLEEINHLRNPVLDVNWVDREKNHV